MMTYIYTTFTARYLSIAMISAVSLILLKKSDRVILKDILISFCRIASDLIFDGLIKYFLCCKYLIIMIISHTIEITGELLCELMIS